jgi:hypothetical protein
VSQRNRSTGHTALTPLATDPDVSEALRQVIARQIGPRRPGTVYDNATGTYEVVTVITDRDEARRRLRRRAAQFAVEIRDLHTGQTDLVGTVWTGSDRVLKAVA